MRLISIADAEARRHAEEKACGSFAKKTSISLFRINAGDRDRQGPVQRSSHTARREEPFPACATGSPITTDAAWFHVGKIQTAWSRAASITWLISASVRPFIASAARSSGSDISTPVRMGNPIFQPRRDESIWICSRHPYVVFASLLNPSGKIDKINKVAEREGFEPPIPVKVYTLSRRAPSATRPSLRAH